MTQIIDRFLKHLHRQGVVCRCRNKWSCEIDYVQVVATIEMAEEARQQQAQRDEEERLADQQRRRREKERRVQQAATVFAARRTRQTRSLTASADAPVRQDEQATVPCRACGEPLTILLAGGYHILCVPNQVAGKMRPEPPVKEEGTLF
jgi:hypothetical protein